MANNFEYKIHVSIDQNSVKDDVKQALANMAKEVKNNAFQIELTGDPKNLIQQLVNLKKQVPSLDLSKGLQFNLADAITDNTEQGKKIISEFATYIINSVSEAVTSIDAISDSIKNTESALEGLKARRKNLLKDDGSADAVTAFEKAQERLEKASNKFADSKQNKGKLVAAEEMKQAYQDIINYQSEAGKEMSDKTKQILGVFAQDTANVFKNANGEITNLAEHLKDVKINSSYKDDLRAIESQIFENENKLTQLKKNLESAQNPELQVKGKLADNFLGDLQSQLDQMTGLEVKVKPKVDKDVKLEIETAVDVKPTKESKIELPKAAEKIDLGQYDLSKIDVVNEKLSEYKSEAESISESAQKAVDELNKFTGSSYTLDRNMYDLPSTLRHWNQASMSANDFKKEIRAAIEANEKEKAAVLYENLKTYYPKSSATLDTFKDNDFKQNYDSYLAQGKVKQTALQLNPDLQRYRVLEDAIFELQIKEAGLKKEISAANAELEKQTKIASELSKYDTSTKDSRNVAIQSLDKQILEKEQEMNRLLKLDEDFQKDWNTAYNQGGGIEKDNQALNDVYDKYGIENRSGKLSAVIELANKRGELADTIDVLKNTKQTIIELNEATSAPSNTSAMDTVEEELREEAQAHHENAEAAKADAKAQEEFNNSQHGNQNNLLSEGTTTPSAIDEITQAEDRMGNEAQEATDQAKQGLAEMREEAEKTTKSIANVLTAWNGVDTSSNERFMLANSQTGYHTDPTAQGDYEFISQELVNSAIKNAEETVDTMIHTHPDKLAAFTHDDIFAAVEEMQQGIVHQYVKADSEVSYIDFSKLGSKTWTLIAKDFERRYNQLLKTDGWHEGDNVTQEMRDNFQSKMKQALKDSIAFISGKGIDFASSIYKTFSMDDIRTMQPMPQSPNETPVSTAETSSVISQLEKEAEVRQENVSATDAQIEAELKRQSISSNVNPTDVNTEVNTLNQTQQSANLASEAVSHVKEEVAQTKQELSDTSTPMLDSIESEANEVSESVDDVNKKIDTLANHPFPVDKTFDNQKISAMMSLRNLEDSLPSNYTGDVKQQIDALHTELLQLTEDDGLSIWASKFKIVADNVKDVNNETKALKNNQNFNLDKSLKVKELDKYVTKLKELELYSDDTKNKIVELYNKLGSATDKSDLSIYSKELKLLQSELAEQVQIRQQTANAKKTNDMDEVQRKIQLLKLQYEYETKLAGLNPKTDASSYKIYDDAIKDIKKSVNEIILTEEQQAQVTEKTAKQRIAAEAAVANAKKKQSADIERENNRQVKSEEQAERKRTALLKRLSNLMLNGQIMKNSGNEIRNYFDIVQSEGGRSIDTLNQIEKEINDIEINAKSTGKTGQTMFQMLQQRWQSLAAYLGSFASFYRIVDYTRQAITVVKEFDDALTEMRKVSDESVSTLKAFQQESFNIATQVGSTAKVIQDSTADWMRLGRVKAYAPLYSNIY